MDEIALTLVYGILGIAALAAVAWVAVRSPFVYTSIKALVIVGWGLATFGACIFAALWIHWPRGHTGLAIVCLVFAALLFVPWLLIGYPELRRMWPKGRQRST